MPVPAIYFDEDPETYLAFARDSPELIPLFHQPWWLDLSSPHESWSAITAVVDNSIVAYMIIQSRQLFGFRAAMQPKEGFFAGPFFPDGDDSPNLKEDVKRRIIEGFAAAIEKYKFYKQYWHYSVRDWTPFYWRGYKQTTRYTYQLRNRGDLKGAFAGFSSNIRRLIRKATESEQIFLDDSVGVSEFLALNRVTYSRKGEIYPHDDKILQSLFVAGLDKKVLKIVGVRNQGGQLVAANVYGVDSLSVYYLQGASTDWGRQSGAVALCFWEGIKLSESLGVVFDFEGSMLRGVEKYVRSFGAEQVEYYSVSRLKLPLNLPLATMRKLVLRIFS